MTVARYSNRYWPRSIDIVIIVKAALVTATQVLLWDESKAWMAGTSPP